MVLITVVAKLFDPVIIVLAVLCGGFLRHAAVVAVAAIVSGLIYEIALANLSYRPFSLASFAMATVAVLIWAGLVFWGAERRRRIQARENAPVETEPPAMPPRPAPVDAQANKPSFDGEHNILKEADRETVKKVGAVPDLKSGSMSPAMTLPAGLAETLWQTAERRASAYAPPPKHEPVIAGMTGLAVAAVVVMVFLSFAGLDSAAFAGAIAWTGLIGFLAPFLYFKHQERQHNKAFVREMATLRLGQ